MDNNMKTSPLSKTLEAVPTSFAKTSPFSKEVGLTPFSLQSEDLNNNAENIQICINELSAHQNIFRKVVKNFT